MIFGLALLLLCMEYNQIMIIKNDVLFKMSQLLRIVGFLLALCNLIVMGQEESKE
ncbi:MAG: hypothetical protein V8R57_05165 [Evtepia sp.]